LQISRCDVMKGLVLASVSLPVLHFDAGQATDYSLENDNLNFRVRVVARHLAARSEALAHPC